MLHMTDYALQAPLRGRRTSRRQADVEGGGKADAEGCRFHSGPALCSRELSGRQSMLRCTPASAHNQCGRQLEGSEADSREGTGKRALAGSHRAATRRLPRLGSRGPPRPLGLQGRQGVIPCVVCALRYPHEGHCPLDGPRRAGLSRRLVATASRSHAPTPSSGESRSSLATRATREAVSESLCGVRKALST